MSKKYLNYGVIFIVVILIMFILVLSTKYIGSTDVGDYAGTAKFFAGYYNAKICSSHSCFYGFMSSPFVKITGNLLGMKIMSFIWLVMIMLSVYLISKKDKRTLLLIVTAPIFWYMAPWINPIQIASLLFLWGYYFIDRYEKSQNKLHVFLSGVFIGLSWVFWDSVIFFAIALSLVFFLNKKLSHTLLFTLAVFIGVLPRLILDQILFNFLIYSILRNFVGNFVNLFYTGISGAGGHSAITLFNIAIIPLMLPLFSFTFLKPEYFKENKKTVIFLLLSLLIIFMNPQTRYTLLITPIILLNLGKSLSDKQFKWHLILSIFILFVVTIPYIIQINYDTNAEEITSLLRNIGRLEISSNIPEEILDGDLRLIATDYPSEKFVVGNDEDFYANLAVIYWGDQINEFISIQDYRLGMSGEKVIFEKEFHPLPNIEERREIWIKGGISKTTNDETDYNSVKYAISDKKEIDLNGFKLVKSYDMLNVFEKQESSE